MDTLIAICRFEHAATIAENTGRKASIRGRDAVITYQDWYNVAPPYNTIAVTADFRNEHAVVARVTAECQSAIDGLSWFDTLAQAEELESTVKALDANAKLALDEIGFGEPDRFLVRHRICPLHPDHPEHPVGISYVHVSKHVACDVEAGKFDGLDVYRATNALEDRPTAAKHLLDALIEKHGRDGLKLEALDD